METLLDWMDGKHLKMAKVIQVASSDPWTFHGEENVCVGCLPILVNEFMADVPQVMSVEEAKALVAAGVLDEEYE